MTGPLRRRDVPPSATPLREAAPAAPVEPGVSPAVPVETALTGPHPATWRRCFPAREISVPEARDWARALLSGRVPAALLDDALLLLSEVVTNAVTHSDSARAPHGRVVVHITRTSTAVRVEVAGGGASVERVDVGQDVLLPGAAEWIRPVGVHDQPGGDPVEHRSQ